MHVFLHVVIATAAVMIGRHNSLAHKLEAEIITVHCHATASLRPVAILPQICTVYENVKAL